MAKFKGSGIVVLKKLLESKSSTALDLFLSSLTEEERNWFKKTVPITWLPVEIATTLSKKAGQVLYPNDPQFLFKLGQARARENVRGLYKIFFKILSPETVIKNAAKLWPQHHDEGKAVVESISPHQAVYCVTDYPDLPEDFRKIIEGFVYGIMEVAGAKQIQTKRIETNPDQWEWPATWQ